MKRHRFLTLLLSALSATLLSCGDDKGNNETSDGDAKSGSKGTIGMTCMDLNNPFFRLIEDTMRAELEKEGYKLVAQSADKDPARQIKQMRDFVAQECTAIFLHPTDSKALAEGIKHAHEAGTPVFTFDMEMESAEVRKMVTAHIGSDNFQGGELAGASMMKLTGGKGKIGIVELPTAGSCVKRVDGFKKHLGEVENELDVVSELDGQGSIDVGYKVANDMLSANPDLVAIFCVNDPCALGTYKAVQERNLTDQIKIIGFDGSPDGKKGVRDGKLYDTPQQFPAKMAVETVANFVKHQKGDDIEKSVFLPCKHYLAADAEADTNIEGWTK